MKRELFLVAGLAVSGLIAGCVNIPPGAERGPHNTMAYLVKIEASDPNVRIEANHQSIGTAPLTLKIFGDPDGTFHDFGSYYYIIQAFPNNTNQFVQTAMFRTGHLLTPEDRIPERVYFDMNRPPPYPQGAPPAYYPPPYYGPNIYFGVPVYPYPYRYRYWW